MDTLFLVVLVLEALFGIGFVLVPAEMVGPLGVTLDEISTPFARLLGSAMFSYPVLPWFARRSTSPEFKRGAACCLLAYFLISTVVLAMAEIADVINVLGWGLVAVHAAFAVTFANRVGLTWRQGRSR